jgi:hypothetical protein
MNILLWWGGVVSPELEDHPLSAVCDCLLSIFAATVPCLEVVTSIRILNKCHAIVTVTKLYLLLFFNFSRCEVMQHFDFCSLLCICIVGTMQSFVLGIQFPLSMIVCGLMGTQEPLLAFWLKVSLLCQSLNAGQTTYVCVFTVWPRFKVSRSKKYPLFVSIFCGPSKSPV